MKFEGSSIVPFEQVTIVSTNKSVADKELSNVDVGVDCHKVYIGTFDSKWKDVEDLELRSEDGFLTFVDNKKHRHVECTFPVGKRKKFESIIRKILSKREKKLKKSTPAATAGPRKQRRTYGRNSKPLKRIIHRDNWLSEDEEDYNMDRVKDEPDDINDNASDDASENDQDVDSEPEPEMEDEDPPMMEHDDDGFADDAVKDDDDFINNEVEEENEEVDDEEDKETTKTPKSRLQEGRRRLRKRVVDSFADSDSDDDFGTVADMTTPMMQQRIVSPAEAGRTTDKVKKMDDSGTNPPPKGDIASFFNPRGTTKPKSSATEAVVKTPAAKTSPPGSKIRSTTPKRKFNASPLRKSQVPDWLTAPTIHPALSPARSATRDRLTSPPRTGKKEFQSKHTWSKFEEEDTAPKDESLASPVSPAKSPKRSVLKRRKLVSNSYPGFGTKQQLSPSTQLFNKDTNAATVEVNYDEPPCTFARGIANLGNTCYLGASLQMLYTAKDFVRKLEGKGADLVGSIVSAGHRLEDMTVPGPASVRPIKNAIDKQTDAFQGYSQRDAHECLGFLLDKIHDELSPPKITDGDHGDGIKGETKAVATDESDTPPSKKQADAKISVGTTPEDAVLPTDEYFRCNIEVCLTCQSCGYSRTKQEMYRHLSLDIGNEAGAKEENMEASVEKSLKLFFQPEEREIKCEKCEDGKTASQTLRLLSRPKALLLHLKRFVPGINVPFRKNKDPIALSERLSMDEFLCDTFDDGKDSPNSEQRYSLKSLVYHIGSTASSGHYTADALRTRPATPEEVGKETCDEWVSFDDSKACMTKLSDTVASEQKKKTAYMLLYTLD